MRCGRVVWWSGAFRRVWRRVEVGGVRCGRVVWWSGAFWRMRRRVEVGVGLGAVGVAALVSDRGGVEDQVGAAGWGVGERQVAATR
ncbi:hypothetical protein BJY16_008278 [Actinoplanes octamycinicus]|uniref:Uncharacterized protein n=1 Tax=Actinoplanes octamycinicus TaxID=135948 RepID=A0A7W7H6J4_9ACTN|nr:hypothetical protein [Actinoplanes octamycinicus]